MRFQHPSPHGYTLIELLCSMAIGSLILLGSAALIGAANDSYAHLRGRIETDREGRSFINILANDLSTARFHRDTIITPSAEKWPASRLGFLSLQSPQAQTDSRRIGDLCAVRYYVNDLTICGQTVRCLLRGFHDSQDTFQALRDDRVSALLSDPSAADEIVALGVVSFEATPKSRDNTGNWIDWTNNQALEPEAIAVRIVIARKNVIGRLKTTVDWDGMSESGKLLGNPSETFMNRNLETYNALMRFGNEGAQ